MKQPVVLIEAYSLPHLLCFPVLYGCPGAFSWICRCSRHSFTGEMRHFEKQHNELDSLHAMRNVNNTSTRVGSRPQKPSSSPDARLQGKGDTLHKEAVSYYCAVRPYFEPAQRKITTKYQIYIMMGIFTAHHRSSPVAGSVWYNGLQ